MSAPWKSTVMMPAIEANGCGAKYANGTITSASDCHHTRCVNTVRHPMEIPAQGLGIGWVSK
jgi:hypothetical protein